MKTKHFPEKLVQIEQIIPDLARFFQERDIDPDVAGAALLMCAARLHFHSHIPMELGIALFKAEHEEMEEKGELPS